jgi:hypothetical protein
VGSDDGHNGAKRTVEGEGDMSALQVIETVEERPSLALELPIGTTFDEWISIGRRLRLGSQALQWQVGDWWRFGVLQWGEEETRKSALDIWGVEGESARVYGWVASKFDAVSRLTSLSFSHYQEAASLPVAQARELLSKAEREHLSKNQLRREVQALKAANDPDRVESNPPQPEAKAIPTHSAKAELTGAYEMVIEFAEALEKMRALTKREARLYANARSFVTEAHSGHRPCPADFDVIFVEKGRLECEAWYAASRMTVNRWLLERGKSRLVKLRADFIRHIRDERRTPINAPSQPSAPIDEKLYAIAKHAAHFLRVSRYGGWRVSPTDDGAWFVGTVRKSSDELIAMAERQGFDSLQIEASLSVADAGAVKP